MSQGGFAVLGNGDRVLLSPRLQRPEIHVANLAEEGAGPG